MVGNKRYGFGVIAASAVVVLGSAWSTRAQDAPETKTRTERIREKASSAADSVKKGVSNAGEAVRNKLAQAREHVVAMEIETRVYARLRWDKLLVGTKIDLDAPRQGTIVLNGTVSSVHARDKAIALASETVGVIEVVDHITVAPPEPSPEAK